MPINLESIQSHIPYYLTQEAKENLVKALETFPNVNYYTRLYNDDILQGDGWNSLEVINFYDSSRKQIKGIILSNSCDISVDNKRSTPVNLVFAPLIKLSNFSALLTAKGISEEQVQNKLLSIRNQLVSSIFYLPKGGCLDEEYLALLDDVHTKPFEFFQSNHQKSKLFTLSQVGFYMFLLKLSVHFCRFHENVFRDEALA